MATFKVHDGIVSEKASDDYALTVKVMKTVTTDKMLHLESNKASSSIDAQTEKIGYYCSDDHAA